jgi:hypothetical protein
MHVVLDASGREAARSGTLDATIESAIAELLGERRDAGQRE